MSSLHEYHGGLSTSTPTHRHAPRVQGTKVQGTKVQGTKVQGTKVQGTKVQGTNLIVITGPHSDAACKATYGDDTARFLKESGGGGDCWCHDGKTRNGQPEYKPCYEY